MEQQAVNYISSVGTNVLGRWFSTTLKMLPVQKNNVFVLISGLEFKKLKNCGGLNNLLTKRFPPLRGGGKKRKKKNYTKPKKIKHVRKLALNT